MSNPGTTSQNADSPEGKAFRKILNWSKSKRCPEWQRDAIRRLFLKSELDECDLEELLKICKGDAKPLTFDNIPRPSVSKNVTLSKIYRVRHVNALKSDQEFVFSNTGMTVVYGDNGAGKSGYVRILKKACRALPHRDDDIIMNIYENRRGGPKLKSNAVIDFIADGRENCFMWELGSPTDPELATVSVFDMRTASVHVDNENELSYKPAPLEMMGSLANTCLWLRAKLEKKIETLQDQTPSFFDDPPCSPTSRVGELLRTLSADTDVRRVEELVKLSDSELARLKELDADISVGPAKTVVNLRNMIDKVYGAKEFISGIIELAGDENIRRLRDLECKFKSEREAEDLARHELFSGEPLPDVGADVWRNLWEAARLYSEGAAYVGLPFPETGKDAKCVLCQNKLNSETTTRLERFEEFVRGGARKRVRATEQAFRKSRDAVAEAFPAIEKLRQHVAMVRGELKDPVLAASLRRASLIGLCRLRAAIRPQHKANKYRYPSAESAPIGKLDAYRIMLERKALAIGDPEEWKRMQKERDELRDRKWLGEIKKDVLDHILRLKKIEALTKSRKTTDTREITMISSKLADDLVTRELKDGFEREIRIFNLKGVDIEIQRVKSSYGNPIFRIRLIRNLNRDARVVQVLSDGEHQCVALAAFFAELATNNGKSAIVFDEPAASLDNDHRILVAERLAEESRRRQVVVFTHDKTFLGLLREVCQPKPGVSAIPIECRFLGREDDYAGICIS